MRLDQLQGSLKEIKDHPMVGKGYNWNGFYRLKYGDHPVILAFESLIFIVLCNSGYLGAAIWIIFFLLLLRVHRRSLRKKENIFLVDALVIVYGAYAIGTGEYGYLSFFALYHVFLILYLQKTEVIVQKTNS